MDNVGAHHAQRGAQGAPGGATPVFAATPSTQHPPVKTAPLQRVVTELGEAIPDDELREMIEEADRDADGFVVFDDFYRCVLRPSLQHPPPPPLPF